MIIDFYKYQGAGNDFIIIDNRTGFFPKDNPHTVSSLCDRNFGIGADGLILLEKDTDTYTDFKMVYYNSDGNQSTMCGNGGRCLVAFAHRYGIINSQTTFLATDGIHTATIDFQGFVSLKMNDVSEVKIEPNYIFLNTGSPHHVELVSDLKQFPVKEKGAAIRYGNLYGETGSNVNFVEQKDTDSFELRTYERGVEDETLACGTGATAVAIAMNAIGKTNSERIYVQVKGGHLEVSFEKKEKSKYVNVFLKGPAKYVFKGIIEI